MRFVGRDRELRALQSHLDEVRASGDGRLVAIRGRRQVGKSTLVDRFLAGLDAPSAFYAATRYSPPSDQLRAFVEEVRASSLEAAESFAGLSFDSWTAALRQLGRAVTRPSVLVIDELPWLLEQDPAVEGSLQVAWDRVLARVPLLVLVIGSDVAMMEVLATHGRPLYGRARELVVDVLTVADVAELLGVDAATAFDAYLVVGGYPTLAAEWRGGMSVERMVRSQLEDSSSPLVVVGERVLTGELPATMQARAVLEAVGGGETTFTGIAARAALNQGSLTRSLRALTEDKRLVSAEKPLAAGPSRDTRYLIRDEYLRFWLRFIGPGMELILRGRGATVADDIKSRWSDYRGVAVEPLIRRSVERMLPRPDLGGARFVGSYWTRTGDVEVDLVGARGARAATDVEFVGTIKWRARAPLDRHDVARLSVARARVPGAADARLVGVTRSGCTARDLDLVLGPDELLAAWR